MKKTSLKEDLIYEKIFVIFSKIFPLSDHLKTAIQYSSEIIEVKKKKILLQEGTRSDAIYFIVNGAARIYYLNKKGIETTTWLLLEGEFLISVNSFFTNTPSVEYIETLEDCILIRLKKDKLNKLYEEFMEFNFIGRKLTEYYYIKNEEQTNSLRMLNAKQRYEQLLITNPKIIQRIPLTYISSFLGMKRETLSRIRNC